MSEALLVGVAPGSRGVLNSFSAGSVKFGSVSRLSGFHAERSCDFVVGQLILTPGPRF